MKDQDGDRLKSVWKRKPSRKHPNMDSQTYNDCDQVSQSMRCLHVTFFISNARYQSSYYYVSLL